MVKEFILMLMGNSIKVNFKMEKSQEEEFMSIKVELSMMENGKEIKKMDLEFLLMQIIKSIKETG